jgi:hypothetical protein
MNTFWKECAKQKEPEDFALASFDLASFLDVFLHRTRYHCVIAHLIYSSTEIVLQEIIGIPIGVARCKWWVRGCPGLVIQA